MALRKLEKAREFELFQEKQRPEFVPGAAGAEGQRGLQKCIIFGERLLQLNLKSLAMEAGHKFSGCPTPPEPIFESLSVYPSF
jgi:hypothetical protein